MSKGSRHRMRGPWYLPHDGSYEGCMGYMASMGYDPWKGWYWLPAIPSYAYWPPASVEMLSWKEECWDDVHPGPPFKTGGPMFLKKLDVRVNYTNASFISHASGCSSRPMRSYSGLFCIPLDLVGSMNPEVVYNSWEPRASMYGATAWKLYKPLKPSADLGQFWYELRDWHSMFQTKVRDFKSAGSQYLNYEFGWSPFVNDVRKFIKAMRKLEDKLSWMLRNNNKWIKRCGAVDHKDEATTVDVGCNLIIPVLTSEFYYPYGLTTHAKRTISKIERTWFEGRFKYFIPKLECPSAFGMWDAAGLAAKIFGLSINPSLLWELTPWSWLVDWFSNVGDVISNMSTWLEEDLTAKYAYVMDDRIYRVEYHQDQPIACGGNVKCSSSFEIHSKEREEASPFGFALSFEDFTERQKAILGVLLGRGDFKAPKRSPG